VVVYHMEYTYTVGMDREEVEAVLREVETATLALARDDDAYAVPVAIHYDGDRVLLRLGAHEGSKKMAFLAATDTATLLWYEYEPPDGSRSIVLEGRLRALDGDDRARERAADELLPLRVFGEAVDDLEPRLYAFEIETATGRRTSGTAPETGE